MFLLLRKQTTEIITLFRAGQYPGTVYPAIKYMLKEKIEYPITNKEYPTEEVKRREKSPAHESYPWILDIPCSILVIEKKIEF